MEGASRPWSPAHVYSAAGPQEQSQEASLWRGLWAGQGQSLVALYLCGDGCTEPPQTAKTQGGQEVQLRGRGCGAEGSLGAKPRPQRLWTPPRPWPCSDLPRGCERLGGPPRPHSAGNGLTAGQWLRWAARGPCARGRCGMARGPTEADVLLCRRSGADPLPKDEAEKHQRVQSPALGGAGAVSGRRWPCLGRHGGQRGTAAPVEWPSGLEPRLAVPGGVLPWAPAPLPPLQHRPLPGTLALHPPCCSRPCNPRGHPGRCPRHKRWRVAGGDERAQAGGCVRPGAHPPLRQNTVCQAHPQRCGVPAGPAPPMLWRGRVPDALRGHPAPAASGLSVSCSRPCASPLDRDFVGLPLSTPSGDGGAQVAGTPRLPCCSLAGSRSSSSATSVAAPSGCAWRPAPAATGS